jgi:hypothetical protein
MEQSVSDGNSLVAAPFARDVVEIVANPTALAFIAGCSSRRSSRMSRAPFRVPPYSYWLKRAIEARRLAERAADEDARKCMLAIARTYDQIADVAERPKEPE